jgi:flagellar biosynthetic protein FliR
MNNTPRRFRIGFSMILSMLLYQVLTPAPAVVFHTVFDYAIIVTKEAIAGLLIAFSTNICTSILNFAGSVADMEVGLSMVQLMDPNTRQQTSFTGILYNYSFTMMLIATGLYRYLLGALVDTFTLIPVNHVYFHSDQLLDAIVRFMGDYVMIGFRIILPIFCCILMLNAVLGIIARVSPQMNMFSIGIQLKILIGLGVMFFTVSLMPTVSEMIYTEMKEMMVLIVSGMME